VRGCDRTGLVVVSGAGAGPTTVTRAATATAPRSGLVALLTWAFAAIVLAAGGCHEGAVEAGVAVPGGDPDVGRRLLDNYGCGECHVIPGVAGADSWAGPPLTEWSARRFIAGALPNTPENLMLFIMDPDSVEPGTAMPDLGVDTAAARHMAAYLFTLRLENPIGPPHPLPLRWLESLLPAGSHQRSPPGQPTQAPPTPGTPTPAPPTPGS
jgi:cytochrome c